MKYSAVFSSKEGGNGSTASVSAATISHRDGRLGLNLDMCFNLLYIKYLHIGNIHQLNKVYMKRSLFFLCAVAAIAVACEKNNNQEVEVQDANTFVYD